MTVMLYFKLLPYLPFSSLPPYVRISSPLSLLHTHTYTHTHTHTHTLYTDIPFSYDYDELPQTLETGLLSTLGPQTPSCRWVSHVSSVGDGVPPSASAPETINLVPQIASDSSGSCFISNLLRCNFFCALNY